MASFTDNTCSISTFSGDSASSVWCRTGYWCNPAAFWCNSFGSNATELNGSSVNFTDRND